MYVSADDEVPAEFWCWNSTDPDYPFHADIHFEAAGEIAVGTVVQVRVVATDTIWVGVVRERPVEWGEQPDWCFAEFFVDVADYDEWNAYEVELEPCVFLGYTA